MICLNTMRCAGHDYTASCSTSNVILLHRPLPRMFMHSTRLTLYDTHRGLTVLPNWQVLLRWLDKLTEELAASETRALEVQLQQTAETALRQQAEQSTLEAEMLSRQSKARRH